MGMKQFLHVIDQHSEKRIDTPCKVTFGFKYMYMYSKKKKNKKTKKKTTTTKNNNKKKKPTVLQS